MTSLFNSIYVPLDAIYPSNSNSFNPSSTKLIGRPVARIVKYPLSFNFLMASLVLFEGLYNPLPQSINVPSTSKNTIPFKFFISPLLLLIITMITYFFSDYKSFQHN